MTKLMNLVAIAALTTVGAAPAIAQQTADPFVSTQGQNLTNLSDETVALIAAGAILGLALVLDDDGNVVGTTTTTTTTTNYSLHSVWEKRALRSPFFIASAERAMSKRSAAASAQLRHIGKAQDGTHPLAHFDDAP